MEITVGGGEVLLCVKPVSQLLISAEKATFVVKRGWEIVLRVPAIWFRPDEEWFARILLEEFAPGDYQVVLEAEDCSDQPKGFLQVSRQGD
ncbi:hypothetical protein L6258_00940 [Candidatus Parcubacteria bacterium]|nr:hypothetical protein [Candidatus Parcubacteria bacterium]